MQGSSIRARLRRHPLAAVIALALAGAPLAAAHADSLRVTSCADDGSPGTLRSVVASANDGDTIDMTRLTCGTITLAQGQLETGYLQLLTFAGPGRDKLTISGGGVSPVLYFGAYGFIATTITLQDLTIAHGHTIYNGKYERASCISSLSGEVLLERVDVTDCHTYFDRLGIVVGGGAVLAGGLTMIDSTITRSSVRMAGGYDGLARGGGAQAGGAVLIRSTISGNAAVGQNAARYAGGGGLFTGSLVMVDSVISGNYCAVTGAGHGAPGGGVYVSGNATLLRSLIAGNSADGDGGGLFNGEPSKGGRGTFTIQSSTIAGNSAGGIGGALVSQWPVSIANSTVADNYSSDGGAVRLHLYWRDYYGNYHVRGWPDFESSIIAGNRAGPVAVYATDLSADAVLTAFGARNLIGDTDAGITLPLDTLRGDPQLNALADNGGRSETMAPKSGSPVIDNGANPLGFNFDQRGPGFPRVVGSAADIGAYEVQSPPVPHPMRQPDPVKPIIAANHVPTVLLVTSCADDGSPGTLRSVAAQALDGDTIDLSGLTCSIITLAQGPIAIGLLGPKLLKTITIDGPGPDALTVSGNGTSAVFQLGGPDHYLDPGTVTVSNLTVADGAKYDTAACIVGFSEYLVLDDVVVTDCHTQNAGGGSWWSGHGGGAVLGRYVQIVDSTLSDSTVTAIDRNVASGGGLWAYKATLTNSTISGNSATAPIAYAEQGYQTAGGGVYATSIWLTDSTISGDSVEATEDGQNANGGGVFARGYLVASSTFANNSADGAGGGLFGGAVRTPYGAQSSSLAYYATTSNSTFTGNQAFAGGAVATQRVAPVVANSTFASNATGQGGALAVLWSGTFVYDPVLYLDSTIISGNTTGGVGGHAADLAAAPNLTLTVTGSNNLVGTADPNVTLPPDTLGGDPLLLSLADNGGPTWTMALAPGSPAINAGSNPWDFATDQRGAGFPRVYGSAADIGAYELQSTPDVIFVSGFDP